MCQAEQREVRILSYHRGQLLKVQAHSWKIGQIKELQRPLVGC